MFFLFCILFDIPYFVRHAIDPLSPPWLRYWLGESKLSFQFANKAAKMKKANNGTTKPSENISFLLFLFLFNFRRNFTTSSKNAKDFFACFNAPKILLNCKVRYPLQKCSILEGLGKMLVGFVPKNFCRFCTQKFNALKN